jgi:hypothetical protein
MLRNLSSRAVALGSAQPLPGIFLGAKGGQRIKTTAPPSVSRFSRKCRILDISQPSTACYRDSYTFLIYYFRNRDSSVGLVTTLQAGRPRSQVSSSCGGKAKIFFSITFGPPGGGGGGGHPP